MLRWSLAAVWPTRLVFTLALSGALAGAPGAAHAEKGLGKETLRDYLRGRDDLPRGERSRWEAELMRRFGGAALNDDVDAKPEIRVAKSIIASAIFMRADPKKAVEGAWEGWRGALGYVPPPIAVHYQLLKLQGRQPRGRPIDLAFKFPDFYNEEIAPELVAYWEEALAAGKIPDDALTETKEALDATRVKMRPLLLDKLRVLARLARELAVARGARRAELEDDLKSLDEELRRAFKNVARRPEVLDARKRPYDRLRIQLEDMGLQVTSEDRLLDPDAPPPPRRAVPTGTPGGTEPKPEGKVEPKAERRAAPEDVPLTEPDRPPPSGPLPDQPRPGDPDPRLDKRSGRSLGELINAYRRRLEGTIEPWVGTPYAWGGAARGRGTDCSGFTQGVYVEAFAIELPRVSRDQYRSGSAVSYEALRPGDLVFFDTADAGQITHVGVYAGDGRFAHASSGRGVIYEKLGEKYYMRAYRGARRLLVFPD